MDLLQSKYNDLSTLYNSYWDIRDTRVDGWFLMSSPLPTICICLTYVYIVKVAGPNYMKDRKPLNIRGFLIVYNLLQVIFSLYLFVQLLKAGWGGDYSFRCQPVDYSDSPQAMLVLNCCYMYYLSKFSEFIDTFCFVARKKFSHISLLHVIHHGVMPLSVWPGMRFVPGGHASFFGFLNVFVHFFMYFYYFMAALGPQYQKYIWWKQHMTSLQMVQFIMIMAHGFQLFFYKDCGFPWQYAYYIGAHAVMFFVLFSQFYIKSYLTKRPSKDKKHQNGVHKNGGHEYNLRNGQTNGKKHD